MRNLVLLFFAGMLCACSMMSSREIVISSECDSEFYVIDRTNARTDTQAQRHKCFGHEYAHISTRKHHNLVERKHDTGATLAGLALSGGGVKSTSFQLGLLAGLHANKTDKGEQLLHFMDYMSSVSGGTWAAATYWAWPENEDSLFECIDGTINGFSNTSVACRFIGEVLLPRKQGQFLNRETWRKQRAEMLLMDDFKLAEWRYPIQAIGEDHLLKDKCTNTDSDEKRHACDDAIKQMCRLELADHKHQAAKIKNSIPNCTALGTDDERLACFRARQRMCRYERLKHKPYPVFNASHSIDIFTEGKSSRNFPFQITPDYMGTIIDCNSLTVQNEEGCSSSRRFFPGHFLDNPKKGVFVRLDKTYSDYQANPFRIIANDYSGRELTYENAVKGPVKYDELFEHEYPSTTQTEDFYLSHAMSSSGGLIATLLSTNIAIVAKDHAAQSNLRNVYKLADGGKSDNLGILPLLERDAKLIIASQIASDKDATFRDLEVVIKQAAKLFGIDLTNGRCVGKNSNDACLDRYLEGLHSYIKDNQIYVHKYTGISGTVGTLVLIKPTTENSMAFREHLEIKYPSLYKRMLQYEELVDNKNLVFPQNPTLSPTYKQEVMFAYYLLGKYLAENGLGKILKNWIAENYK